MAHLPIVKRLQSIPADLPIVKRLASQFRGMGIGSYFQGFAPQPFLVKVNSSETGIKSPGNDAM